MRSPRHLSQPCPVIAETPLADAHFFGFHDICPWDPTNQCLAILRVDRALRRVPDGADRAEICLWEPDSGAMTVVGETYAWNWQQGARAQWLPGEGRRLAYNVLEAGELTSVIIDIDSGDSRTLPFTVSAISPDGRTSLSPHFARLARHWPAYGCPGSTAPGIDRQAPEDDGLWRLDLDTGAVDLILSVADAARVGGAAVPGGTPHFLSHPTYSPSGNRMCVLHRYFSADGALYTRLLAGDADGSALTVLAEEKVSHFDWLDDDTILVWTRQAPGGFAAARRSGILASPLLKPLVNLARGLRPGLKQMMLGEAYTLISLTNPSSRKHVGRGLLERDGHPMYSTDRRWILTDTYPDNGVLTLILYDTVADKRIDIGRFEDHPGTDDSDAKCDLHPRWDRSQRLICIDSTRRSVRQCLIVDAREIVQQ